MGLPWWAAVLGIIGTAIGIGWAILKSKTHDWRTCRCVDCRQKWYYAHKRQGHSVVGLAPDGELIWSEEPKPGVSVAGRWLSTAQLEERMIVVVKGRRYRVMAIKSDRMGYLVQVQPTGGGERRVPFVVTVPWVNGNRKYWEVL